MSIIRRARWNLPDFRHIGTISDRISSSFISRPHTAKEEDMKRFAKIAAVCAFALGAGTISAAADNCSGHSHDTGTALGAGGGALIGGLASHSVVGAVVGGVAGGFAGNAIARSGDCSHRSSHRERDSYLDSNGHRHYR
jgi:hypothetical protein